MSNDIAEIDELDGEDGIPNVNEHISPSRNRVVIVIAVLFVLAVFGWLGYMKIHKKEALAAEKKQMSLSSSVPDRVFKEPPEKEKDIKLNNIDNPVAEHKEKIEMVQPPPIAPPMPEARPKPVLDKSSSSLMISSAAAPKQAEPAKSDGSTGDQKGGMSQMLSATPTPKREAGMLGDRNFVLAKGSFIDCALQTRLDSTVAGMTACVITRNIFSDNGKILLIERGSTVVGEYQSNIKQGQSRIYVLWSRIKTPNGVVINLDSPGTDALGGAGVPGYIDTHFWERFGGAILLSLIDDTAQFAVNESSGGNNNKEQTINLGNTSQASQDMATEALKNTINIPPTLYKNQGENVGIYIARDLDFSSVYAVESK